MWSESFLLELDLIIREGRHSQAKAQLAKVLNEGPPPRLLLASVAALLRRLGQSSISIQLLNPYVRPKIKKIEKPTAAEKAEYAGALIRMGILSEAHRLLDEVPITEYPRSLLFRAFAHISQWDFVSARTPLEKYLTLPNADSYESMTAQVNLLVGHVFREELSEAKPLIESLLKSTKQTESYLLLSNTLEMAAEAAMLERRWAEAKKYLDEAEKLLSASDSIDAFLIKKQRSIIDLRESPKDISKFRALQDRRVEAINRKHWESVRDCDFHLAFASRDKELGQKLFFGTPHEGYRWKIKKSGLYDEMESRAGHSHMLYLGRGDETIQQIDSFGRVIAISNGTRKTKSKKSDFLSPGQVPHRLFKTLTQDSYRPFRLMELFDRVFVGENYFSGSSADKMRQCLKRLRQFFKKNKIKLVVREENSFYRLDAEDGQKVSIILPNEITVNPKVQSKIEEWKSLVRKSKNDLSDWFSCEEFAQALGISLSTALRLLTAAGQQKVLKKRGSARSTRYQIMSDTKVASRS